mmetsp:Transcript_6419/g.11100  ORF Transcript_6419/g.11100 Transcript_6419/m.11100 type:complete len:225 (-) Transcript_6419:409-1083(-)
MFTDRFNFVQATGILSMLPSPLSKSKKKKFCIGAAFADTTFKISCPRMPPTMEAMAGCCAGSLTMASTKCTGSLAGFKAVPTASSLILVFTVATSADVSERCNSRSVSRTALRATNTPLDLAESPAQFAAESASSKGTYSMVSSFTSAGSGVPSSFFLGCGLYECFSRSKKKYPQVEWQLVAQNFTSRSRQVLLSFSCASRETPDDTMMSKEVNTSIGNASIGP